MNFLASISPEAIGTAFAAIVASLTGFAAYRTNVHQKETDHALAKTDLTAELAKTEVDGWKTLIETLTLQYKASMNESTELRERLTAGNLRFEELTILLTEAKENTHTGLMIIHRLENEIRELKSNVVNLLERLAASSDRDMRRVEEDVSNLRKASGKVGPKGDRGDTGNQGDRGHIGHTGSKGSKGTTGDQGDQGTQGDQGDQGTQGDQGDQGTQGEQGRPGRDLS